MEAIIAKRGCGKTTRLIQKCAAHGGYIVCHSHDEAFRVSEEARRMEVQIPFPLSYDEFCSGQFYTRGIKCFHIDNADELIRHLARGVKVETITLTENQPTTEGGKG